MEPQSIVGGSSTWELEILVECNWRFNFSGIWPSLLLLRQFYCSMCGLYVVSNSVTQRHIPQLQLSSMSQTYWMLNVLYQYRQKITTHCPLHDLFPRVFMLRIKSRSKAFANSLQHDTFLQRGVVTTSPNPHYGAPPHVGCPRPLIRYVRRYPPYRRLFLHPQPEDVPCRGDMDPLIMIIMLRTQDRDR